MLTLLEVLSSDMNHFQSYKFEASSLEAADDLADETALDTVGLCAYMLVSGSRRETGRSRAP